MELRFWSVASSLKTVQQQEFGEIGCKEAGENIMTTLIVHCPNAACGRVSHLGVDPLGRIFRCPRCLTKLPTAPATAADTGWTAVLDPPRSALDGLGFRLMPSGDGMSGNGKRYANASSQREVLMGFESGEVLIDVD